MKEGERGSLEVDNLTGKQPAVNASCGYYVLINKWVIVDPQLDEPPSQQNKARLKR